MCFQHPFVFHSCSFVDKSNGGIGLIDSFSVPITICFMRRYFPDFQSFSASADSADVIPVYRQLLGDRLTPVSAFEVLGRDAHAFLLESVVGGEKIARYSFIATAPSLVYQVSDGNAAILPVGSRLAEGSKQFKTTDPLADLQRLLPRRRYRQDPHLPAFTGGLVGYAGYDTVRYYEGEKLPNAPRMIGNCPICFLGFTTIWSFSITWIRRSKSFQMRT